MGKKSLDNFCKKLFVNLTESFVFYIPDNSAIKESIIEAKAEEFKNYLQKVIMMDWHKGPLMYAKSSLQFNEFDKRSLLSKNVLKLIEQKEQLAQISFEYIFDSYYDQVRSIIFISHWLNDDSRLKMVDDKRHKTIQTFKLQQNLFETHLSELEKVFRSNKIKAINDSTSDKLELQLPILLDELRRIETNQLSSNKIVEQLIASSHKQENHQKIITKRPKRILVNDREVEHFLLATVFGINLQQ